MSPEELEAHIRSCLDRALHTSMEVPSDVVEEFGELCKNALRRRFSEAPNKGFTLRMSNVGRPTCQLEFEQKGAPREGHAYNHTMKMMFGELIEALALAVIRIANVPVDAYQQQVSLKIKEGDNLITTIDGTLDVVIGGKVYDIKSASSFAYEKKFATDYMGGWNELKASDGFGYVAQGYGYSIAAEKPFGGWIVVNKETGEVCVTEAPNEAAIYETVYNDIVQTVKKVMANNPNDEAVTRCFEDEAETYKRMPTGNRVLSSSCRFCDYKWGCWPGLQYVPQSPSDAKNPRMVYYTSLESKNDKRNIHRFEEGQGEEVAVPCSGQDS